MFGLTIIPDDITNSISLVVVAAAAYYAVKIIRLSRNFEYVALKGGRAPYFIVAGIFALAVEQMLDLASNWLTSLGVNYQLALTFNDPPAALAGVLIVLGLREMYQVYISDSKGKRAAPSHDEIWPTESRERTHQ